MLWTVSGQSELYSRHRSLLTHQLLADTHLSARYFSQISLLHAGHPDTCDTTIYVPPLVFDRNLHHVPLPVRTADILWAGAGISSLYPGSRVCIPTSVYALSMKLVESVGGWDCGPEAIGEDMHMYVKCFFALSGHLTARVVYAAASQSNIGGDRTGIVAYVQCLQARYGQALRHMWGSLDTGYAVRQGVLMLYKHCWRTWIDTTLYLIDEKYVLLQSSKALDKSNTN